MNSLLIRGLRHGFEIVFDRKERDSHDIIETIEGDYDARMKLNYIAMKERSRWYQRLPAIQGWHYTPAWHRMQSFHPLADIRADFLGSSSYGKSRRRKHGQRSRSRGQLSGGGQ